MDVTGYTVAFDTYTQKSTGNLESGLSHAVLMKLAPTLAFQGYELYIDNFYTNPDLFVNLCEHGIAANGEFHSKRHGIPPKVVAQRVALKKKAKYHGKTSIVYCLWKDTEVVLVMSTCYPGHESETKVSMYCTCPDDK